MSLRRSKNRFRFGKSKKVEHLTANEILLLRNGKHVAYPNQMLVTKKM